MGRVINGMVSWRMVEIGGEGDWGIGGNWHWGIGGRVINESMGIQIGG